MSNMHKRLSDATPQDWNKITQSYLMKHNPSSINTTSIDPDDSPADETTVRSSITTDAKARKLIPIHTTLFKYFPKAVSEIANCCVVGGAQHGQEINDLHWDRSKSGGELDALCRHLLDAGYYDTDGIRHSAKIAFRALANLELELEASEKK